MRVLLVESYHLSLYLRTLRQEVYILTMTGPPPYHSSRAKQLYSSTQSSFLSNVLPNMSSEWRMQLNNYLQTIGCAHHLQMAVNPDGPSHRPLWTAIAYFGGVEYARASHYRQQDAIEEAARLTLTALYNRRRY
ncbi:unnamed protein product [Somion occarium]|uniref:DRBM domain-containing protein n=1 Tax=Somion occarium TaxID=3059160 RepID=A0ABP1DJH4_9APHY